MTHIQALEECIENPSISAEAKKHLCRMHSQFLDKKFDRKPTPKAKHNAELRKVLEDNLETGKSYTSQRMADILRIMTGEDISSRRAVMIAQEIGFYKTGTKIKNADGKNVATYQKDA